LHWSVEDSGRENMNLRANLWLKTAYARAWVRTMSMYGEPLWVIVTVGFPLFSMMGMSLLYSSAGATARIGFAILGGIMLSFWGNVLWSMASQFNWDKQAGLFEIYITSPAPISAILVGMSLGGILGTAPSAVMVAVVGWLVFHPPINPAWPTAIATFIITLASLYALGMTLSSLYLVYGREAESFNEALQEPVQLLSGVYFPVYSPVIPLAVQAVASVIPLTIGMDALRRTLFLNNPADVNLVYTELLVLGIMAAILLVVSSKSLKALEERGRRVGSIAVRMR